MSGATPSQHYGYWTLVLLVVANMIGAGVFTTSGYALADLGSPALVIIAWTIGGCLALAGAASYGLLIQVMPASGGEYLFLSRAVHPLLGFMAGWLSLVAGFSGATALAAVALEVYALPDDSPVRNGSLAAGVVIVNAALHGIRVRIGSGFQNLVVVLKLGMLLFLCGLALLKLHSHVWHTEALADRDMSCLQLVAAFAGSLVWISLSYSGFNAAVYVADEVALPAQTISHAMWRATILVTVLYLALNAIFVCAVAADQIAGQHDIATIAAAGLGGWRLALFVRITIVLALWSSVSSMMMAGPRVYTKMAEDALLPSWFRHLPSQKHLTSTNARRSADAPVAAIWLQCGLALLLIASFTLRQLLTYLGLTLSLSAAATVACLFLPRIRQRCQQTTGLSDGHLRLAMIAPMIFVAGTTANATLLGYTDPKQLIGTGATVMSGAALYSLVRLRR